MCADSVDPRALAAVLGDGAVVAATRRMLEAEFRRQRAVCTPNTPEVEQSRRRDQGLAENDSARALTDLTSAASAAARRLAMDTIKPEGS